MFTAAQIETIGSLAAVLTTICWLPQTVKTLRTRDTAAISLATQAIFLTGIGLWLVYGVLINSWPLIGANAISFLLVAMILVMKLRYG